MLNTSNVPKDIQDMFELGTDNFLQTPLQQFVYFSKYSRYRYDLGRRETWVETVGRTVDYLKELVTKYTDVELSKIDWLDIYWSILNMEVLPSMRLMFAAGEAANSNEAMIYNCSYLPIDTIDSFPEVLALSMAGVGIGYSVEYEYVYKLPTVMRQTGNIQYHTVVDSTQGWIEAFRLGIHSWYNGDDVVFNYDKLRPAGAPIRTKGGRASGPESLRQLMEFSRKIILEHQGRKLSPINVHDIVTKVGDCVVQGGVRRVAYLAMFSPDDERMMSCKSQENIKGNENRWNANNSIALPKHYIKQDEFFNWFATMFNNSNGEPGFINRYVPVPSRREKSDEFGVNACAEIILRPRQFCNLTTIVARDTDDYEDLLFKAHIASLIGTIQSLATNFPGLSDEWKKNAQEERLLGVSITGYFDSAILMNEEEILLQMREQAIETNKECAKMFGINQSVAVTAVKPSGNSSQLVDASSGVHPRWAKYYIRRVRINSTSPIYKVLRDSGVPLSPENGQLEESATTWVASFPVASPTHSITKDDLTSIEMLKHVARINEYYTEHNVSATIPYDEDEWIDIVEWAWRNQARVTGITFIPKSNAHYEQMPYEEITKEQYEKMAKDFPKIDWSKIYLYEREDMTEASQEASCVAGVCEPDFFGLEQNDDKLDFSIIGLS